MTHSEWFGTDTPIVRMSISILSIVGMSISILSRAIQEPQQGFQRSVRPPSGMPSGSS